MSVRPSVSLFRRAYTQSDSPGATLTQPAVSVCLGRRVSRTDALVFTCFTSIMRSLLLSLWGLYCEQNECITAAVKFVCRPNAQLITNQNEVMRVRNWVHESFRNYFDYQYTMMGKSQSRLAFNSRFEICPSLSRYFCYYRRVQKVYCVTSKICAQNSNQSIL